MWEEKCKIKLEIARIIFTTLHICRVRGSPESLSRSPGFRGTQFEYHCPGSQQCSRYTSCLCFWLRISFTPCEICGSHRRINEAPSLPRYDALSDGKYWRSFRSCETSDIYWTTPRLAPVFGIRLFAPHRCITLLQRIKGFVFSQLHAFNFSKYARSTENKPRHEERCNKYIKLVLTFLFVTKFSLILQNHYRYMIRTTVLTKTVKLYLCRDREGKEV
jgi:hypothetical protein